MASMWEIIMIDLHDLIEQKSPVRLTKVASSHNGEWAGNCPWCSGTDRFRVWPFSTRSHYWCRGCNKTGDAIQFLRDYCDMSFISACQELGIESLGEQQGSARARIPHEARPE